MKIDKKEFKKIYYKCLEDILAIRPIDEALKDILAVHDYDFKNFDFFYYLKQSWIRAWEVYKLLPDNANSKKIKILDIGSFFGNFALCFKRLGYDVTVAEVYDYYKNAFDKLKIFLENEGLRVLDLDFTTILPKESFKEKYDVILCLAVLEHLGESPQQLMSNIRNFLNQDGEALIEVPNIAYWSNRIKLLIGKSILPSIESIYISEFPFMGHRHEYTIREMKLLAQLSGFKIKHIACYNYSADSLLGTILRLPILFFSSCKEIIMVKLEK
jgi:2-polyprenyl-3-methyl-5-hydroxy-6-metoxy-1,4-benzoquinol methylase